MTSPNDFDAERRRIIRKVGLLTWGVLVLAFVLAVIGGALLAWILTGAGYPFLRTWLLVSTLLIAIPAAIHLWPGLRPGGGTTQDTEDQEGRGPE